MKKFFIELFFEGQRWYLRLHLTMINPSAFCIYLYTSYSNTCTFTHIYRQPMQEPDAYPPLDFPKVKEDLAGGPNKKKALLLQAIRWVRENLQSYYL